MKVFIIGGAGDIGRRLATALRANGDIATDMHRDAEQHDAIERAGGIPVLGDLIEDGADALASLMAGHDAVVFSAGAHGTGTDMTTLIDGKGVERAAEAASLAGVPQFLLVSAFADSERGRALGEDFEHYIRVKRGAEVVLTGTDLDWLIVRPGHLLPGAGDGRVGAGLALRETGVRREDLVHFMVEALHSSELTRVIVEVTAGPTPIADAVAQVARSTGPRPISR